MIIKEAAKRLQVTNQTIRTWENIFNISVPRDEQNNRIYDESLISLLEYIKELKAQKYDITAIKQALDNKGLNKYNTPDITPLKSDTVKPGNDDAPGLDIRDVNLRNDIKEIVKAEIQNISELSRDYATAAHRIGQLEAQLQAAETQIKLLPAPDDFYKLQTDNKVLQAELEAVRKENEFLKAPAWKRIYNFCFAKA